MKNLSLEEIKSLCIKEWEIEKIDTVENELIYYFDHLFIDKECSKSLLMEAVERGEIEIIQSLISLGANVNYISKTLNQTPLLSIEEDTPNKVRIARLLVNAGADVNYNYRDDESFKELFKSYGSDVMYDKSVLSHACNLADFELVKFLVENGANINQTNPLISIPEDSSCYHEIIYYLVAHGADINTSGGELLSQSIIEDDKILINYLLGLNAKVDIRASNNTNDGKTALMILMESIHSFYDEEDEILFNKLWRNYENINIKDNEGRSLLFYALEINLEATILPFNLFLKIITHPEIEVNTPDKNGNIALNYFLLKMKNECEEDYFSYEDDDIERVIEYLIIAGSNIKQANKNEISPLTLMYEIVNENIEEMLSSINDLVNKENELGFSPLMVAVCHDNLQQVKWLIKKGAMVDKNCNVNGNYPNDTSYLFPYNSGRHLPKGITALMMANSTGVVEVLLKNGAYIDNQDYNYNTALMHYTDKIWRDGIMLLINKGANTSLKNKNDKTALGIIRLVNGDTNEKKHTINLLKGVTNESVFDRLIPKLSSNKNRLLSD